jgi:hypothetical protein
MSVVRECMPSKKFLNYMALMSSIIDAFPSIFEKLQINKYGKMPW